MIVSQQKGLHAKVFGKVAVLYGGRSAERAISLISGENILNALKQQGVDAYGVDVDQHLIHRLVEEKYDRVFIALHGKEGEDGVIQGLLQVLGLPYTGSGVAASALAMDKARAKLIMNGMDVPTLPFGVAKYVDTALELAETIGFPISVKPVAEGSSIGVTRVSSASEIPAAFDKAAQYGDVLIEKWIDGTDFFVSILGEQVLPSVEVHTPGGFYDYQAKYESHETKYICPSPISEEKEQELRDIAYRAFCALGCTGWGRVDLVQDNHGKFWVLEVNTIPGMTSHSLVPMSAQAVGLSFEALVLNILAATLSSSLAEKIVGEFAQV
ncbi:MAG: D-alanine--D-alanine ligase [Proteobacteria bacterium]|nr:D-alanine--D-alanine ligase [Pseudomonadota bacterium]